MDCPHSRFLVVRHPFERILSAYRDKLEDLSRDIEAREGYYYTMYGKQIVAEFRDRGATNGTEALEPSWREFVTYLLNTPATKYDEHWMPMWMLCSPCIIRSAVKRLNKYGDPLMKHFVDTMQFQRWRHSRRILSIFYNRRVLRINSLLSGNIEQVDNKQSGRKEKGFFPRNTFYNLVISGTGGSSDTIVDYFSQLTKSEIAALFKKYQLDFEFYDYDPEPYFDIASDTIEP